MRMFEMKEYMRQTLLVELEVQDDSAPILQKGTRGGVMIWGA